MSKIVTNQISPRSGDTVTVTEKLNVLGVLTYEDVTNIDSVGIVTAQSGIHVTGGKVGIGTDNPDKLLHVFDSDSGASSNAFDVAVLERNDDCYLKILSANNKVGGINFGDAQGSFMGAVEYDHNINGLKFNVNESERLRITSAGNVDIGINGGSSSNLGHWIQPNGEHWQFIDNGTSYKAYQLFNTTVEVASISKDGVISDSKGDLRDIPQSSNSSQRTLVATDNGKVVMTTSGGWVIPASVMSQGNTVTLLNGDGSDQTVDASALNAFYNTADGSNIKANTITLGGASMATIWFSSGTVAYISATNMSVS